jgi:hypothetical protein
MEATTAKSSRLVTQYFREIEHRAGRSHANADAMSRRPCHKENCSHCSRTEQKSPI